MFGAQFYPNADRLSAATVITVRPGKEVTGIDFHLALRRAVRLKGNVIVRADFGGTPVQVQAYSQDVPDSMGQIFGAAAMPPDYNFEIPNVAPGAYLVVALDRNFRGVARTEVGQSADQNVTIAMEPGIELAGRVVVEGEGPGPEPAEVHLASGDRLPLNGAEPRARLKPDGTFRLANVLRFLRAHSSSPCDWAIKTCSPRRW
jgi:hypothetical protein